MRRPVGEAAPPLWPDDPAAAYRLRWRRRRLLARALRRRGQIAPLADRTDRIRPGAVLCFATMRNEAARLPFFLDHYRALGVGHFLIVSNDSDDGTDECLAGQGDVSLWRTGHGYRQARFGLDWLTWLMIRHAHGHWCLTVDADEILVYPHWTTRRLDALTAWLGAAGEASFGALMLDLYPEGRLGAGSAPVPGAPPTDTLTHFDAGNYTMRVQAPLGALWIQGGPRARTFFAADPRRAPTLQKVPLVRWNRRYVYVNSTHSVLPRRLNAVFGEGEKLTGALLHTKFLPDIVARAGIELRRDQHFADAAPYRDYYRRLAADPILWSPASTRYGGWRHLEALGLISRGGWT